VNHDFQSAGDDLMVSVLSSDWKGGIYHPEWILDRLVATQLDPNSAVLVTGFWRSGTTWVQQILAGGLNAKSVFEPLHYHLNDYKAALVEECNPPCMSNEYLDMFMPFGRCPLPASSLVRQYLRHALTGGIPSHWVRKVRFRRRGIENRISQSRFRNALYRLKDACQKRVVVKSVRAHLLIPAIQKTFNPRIVHLRRDPRSVIASLHRIGWAEKWEGKLSLVDQFLRPTDSRTSFFKSWEPEIRAYEQKGITHRLAAYWSLCERFVASLPDHARRTVVPYKKMYTEGSELIERRLQTLPFTGNMSEYVGAPSATSERRKYTQEERLRRWKEMSPEKIEAVEATCRVFGMESCIEEE
jgi:hypothetical protein